MEVVVRPGAPGKGSIVRALDAKYAATPAEGYELEVEPGRIVV
jgi:hypothetical protein